MSLTLQRSIYTITKRTRKGMRKKSHAFSDAIGQKPTLIIYTQRHLRIKFLPGYRASLRPFLPPCKSESLEPYAGQMRAGKRPYRREGMQEIDQEPVMLLLSPPPIPFCLPCLCPGSPSTGIRLLRRRVRLHSFSANL